MCVEGRGRIPQLSLTQDIKMGSCVFQCDVPHQWIAQRQVSPVSVYCEGVGCHVLCLRHGIPVWQHIGQSTIAHWSLPLSLTQMKKGLLSTTQDTDALTTVPSIWRRIYFRTYLHSKKGLVQHEDSWKYSLTFCYLNNEKFPLGNMSGLLNCTAISFYSKKCVLKSIKINSNAHRHSSIN